MTDQPAGISLPEITEKLAECCKTFLNGGFSEEASVGMADIAIHIYVDHLYGAGVSNDH